MEICYKCIKFGNTPDRKMNEIELAYTIQTTGEKIGFWYENA